MCITSPGVEMRVWEGADEAKEGKEEEQNEYKSQIQESTLDFIISMENRHNIFYITYFPRFVLR